MQLSIKAQRNAEYLNDIPVKERVCSYLRSADTAPLLIVGEALSVLRSLPDDVIDFCMTSPPYWGHRQYETEGIGLERTVEEYVHNLTEITYEIRRVLKPSGSFWLNIGDTYRQKNLLGVPWRVAIKMLEQQEWILRNSVIWHKVKGGPDNTTDKLRNVHENVFHFVKTVDYYYDVDSIRSKPREATVVNGRAVSATGVSGVRYKRQIELSTALTPDEKRAAFAALEAKLHQIHRGELADFRMIIRGQQRTTHSDSARVSGRAKELQERGFYFLNYHKDGAKPSDVWEVLPEDTQKRRGHYAAYPEELCRLPLLATCPPGGVALDPFCGTGTTLRVARDLQRRSIGIDLSAEYVQAAYERCRAFL